MAESQKAKASVDPKDKNEEIGSEFLSSWKSMSVIEDDGMDFSFDTASKGKKKVFDFDKLDMDFNLDGDFNKLSSFKMDMPDLDFSSPHKKAAKTKERSEEDSFKGNRQGKQDHFNFSFDFNELDNFDFGSSLTDGEKSSKKNEDSRKEAVSDRTVSQGSKINLAEEISTIDGDSVRVATSNVDTSLVVSGNDNSMNDDSSEKSETSENLELPHGPRSPEEVLTKSVEELDQQSHSSEMAMPTEPYAKEATHDLPGQLVGGVYSNGDAIFEGTDDGCPQIKVNTISSGKDINDKMLTGDSPDHDDSPLKDSSPLNISSSGNNSGDTSNSGNDISKKLAEPAIDDLDLEVNSNTSISRKGPHNIKSIEEVQNSTLKPPLSMQGSESAMDTLTPTNESKTGAFHSKISKGLEEARSQLCQPLSIGAKSLSSGIKSTGTMHPHPAIEKGVGVNANDAQIGSKLLASPLLVDRETKVKHVMPRREDFISDSVPNRAKLVGNSRLCDKEVIEKEPLMQIEQRKSINDLSQASPSRLTEKTTKPSTQTCLNPQLMLSSLESMRNTKIITAEGNKLCPDKPAMKRTELSTCNISKNGGGNKVPLNPASQKQVERLRSLEQKIEVQGNVELKTARIVDRSEKKMPPNLSLKRKASEGSNSDLAYLKPLKRLSPSTSEIRNVKETSKGVVQEQVCNYENHLESKSKSTLYDHPTSGPGSPCEVNVMKLEIPSVMENDENVEKAEAYAKELEDICSMLKKKHEEAKEMLVRAVVNNNNLLMLNHPIYEAKIHKVQKFAAKLVAKELQTC